MATAVVNTASYVARAAVLGSAVTIFALFCNVLQIVTLPILPFTRRSVSALTRACHLIPERPERLQPRWNMEMSSMGAGIVWTMLQYTAEGIHHLPLTFSGDVIPDAESAIVFSNHVSFSDFLLIHSVAIRRGMLPNCKYFAKDSLKWIPAFGWGMWMMGEYCGATGFGGECGLNCGPDPAGFIFMKRNWTEDKEKVERTFSRIKEMEIPVWLVSFLEGTRIRPHKLVESQNFAKKKDLPILNNVLLPRTRGFIATVQAMRGSHVKAVYDFTLAYYSKRKGFGVRPSLVRVHTHDLASEYRAHVHVRRFLLEDLPTTDEGLETWIRERYVEKDRVLELLKTSWSDGLNTLNARLEQHWKRPILDFQLWDLKRSAASR
ncbi:hypothetical protein DFJ74DRAFT_632105 [Hyaloraphidium curvatum]|nr:hypothetical protein DFJ74DRAFT_632105 [Hyaloraphidium curvatum]